MKPTQTVFLCLAAPLTLLLALPSPAVAHPFHVTIAEAELNPKTGNLEVALKVNPVDLEDLLRRRTKKPIDLDKSKDVDGSIVKYLNEAWTLRTRDGRRRKLQWVGKEVGVKQAWLFFEFAVDGDIEGATIENRVFVNLLPRQTNTIVLTAGKRKATLKFTREQAKRVVAFPSASAKPSAAKR